MKLYHLIERNGKAIIGRDSGDGMWRVASGGMVQKSRWTKVRPAFSDEIQEFKQVEKIVKNIYRRTK